MANGRIAGVASGLSDFLGIDVTLIRALFVLGTCFSGGAGLIAYVVMWAVLPQTYNAAPVTRPRRGLSWLIVVAAVIIGAGVMADDRHTAVFAIIVLIIVASLAMKARGRKSWKTRKEFEKARLAWQRRLDEQAQRGAEPTNLGGNPFQVGSFYSEPPPEGENPQNNSGFQIQ
jgi:phage shock protein PspC (stress-responsive transcriptional regulator)